MMSEKLEVCVDGCEEEISCVICALMDYSVVSLTEKLVQGQDMQNSVKSRPMSLNSAESQVRSNIMHNNRSSITGQS